MTLRHHIELIDVSFEEGYDYLQFEITHHSDVFINKLWDLEILKECLEFDIETFTQDGEEYIHILAPILSFEIITCEARSYSDSEVEDFLDVVAVTLEQLNNERDEWKNEGE